MRRNTKPRRVTRFWDFGHTPGVIERPPVIMPTAANADLRDIVKFSVNEAVPRPMSPPIEEPSQEYPFTMDLRHRGG